MLWSDPDRQKEFDSFVESTKIICTQAVLNDVQLEIHQKKQQNNLQQKSISRKQLKPFGSKLGLIKKDAQQMIAKKEQKPKKWRKKNSITIS